MVIRNQVDSPSQDKAVFRFSPTKNERAEIFIDPPLSEEARLDEKVSKASQDVIEASFRDSQKREAMNQLMQMFGGGAGPVSPPPNPQLLGGSSSGLVGILNSLNTPIGARLT